MGKQQDSSDMKEIQEEISETSSGKIAFEDLKDDEKCLFDYTNRRRIKKSVDGQRSSEERKKENEEEFEYIRLQLEEFSVSGVPSHRPAKLNSWLKSRGSSARHPEVEAFQRFIDCEGGHYGGWKEKDHLFFLNTRKKYPLKKTAEIVHESFPDISVEKVFAHETWYGEYLKLKAAKKRVIEEWKKTQKASVKVEEERNEEPNPQSEPKPQPKRDPKLKEKIEIWKAHCIAAKLEREEQQREEEMKKKKEEEERRKMQVEKRALVNRYREEKISLEIALKTARETEKLEEKREAAMKAATLLKYFRYEDRRFTERQKAKKQPRIKPAPRVKSAVEVKRDPNRLLQPTLGWIYHTKRSSETVMDTNLASPLDLNHMPKLKKPAWRRGLTSP